jgi:hypothetical protein
MLSGVPIFEPGFGRVGVAALFPEAQFILLAEDDFTDPFGSLPRV